MTTERPYVRMVRGKFRIVWAADYNAPYTVERSITGQDSYAWVERACIAAFGVKPEPYGIGF